jgi:guanyl-specific ribonuclease Sa
MIKYGADMNPRLKQIVGIAVVVVSALLAWLRQSHAPSSGTRIPPPRLAASAGQHGQIKTVLDNVTIVNDGETFYRGKVDLGATIERIQDGLSNPHRNDGTVFENREHRLPSQPSGYYTEYVHPTPGLKRPGPQRIVVGQNGEWYYSPDHYRTFIRLN